MARIAIAAIANTAYVQVEVVRYLVQGVDLGHFLSKPLVYERVERPDKEEMMLLVSSGFLEGGIQRALQNLQHLRRRQVEHLAAGRHLPGNPVVGNVAVHERFAVVDAAGSRHVRVRRVLRLEGVVPQFARTVGHVPAQGHRLVAREERREALGADAQVKMAYFFLHYFGFAKRT